MVGVVDEDDRGTAISSPEGSTWDWIVGMNVTDNNVSLTCGLSEQRCPPRRRVRKK
jgi:hypothetical protein